MRLGLVARALLACAVVAASLAAPGPSSQAADPGTSVGFWAGQTFTPCVALDPTTCPRDLKAFTPAVWNALASTHGFLYLDLVYGSDFGPTLLGVHKRTDAVDLIHTANARGVPISAWITMPLQYGLFENEQNAAVVKNAVKAYASWVTAKGLHLDQAVLDLEFPAGYQAVTDAAHGDLSTFLDLAHAQINPVRQCTAMAIYRDTITWAHQHALRISAAPVPFALDDLKNGSLALQDVLNIVAFPPFGYDELYLQAYRTQGSGQAAIDLGSGFVASYYREMQAYFGASGQVSLGNTGVGAYSTAAALIADVRMLAGMEARTVPIFDLEQAVTSYGAAGVAAVVAAGHDPMSGAELAAAQLMTPTGQGARTLFSALDTIATALTPVVTATTLHPRQPNTYPNGCGNVTAAPLAS